MNFSKKLDELLNEDSTVYWDDFEHARADIGDYFSVDSYHVTVENNNVQLIFSRGSESDMDPPESKEDLLAIMQGRIDELSSELQLMISSYHDVADATGEYIVTIEG